MTDNIEDIKKAVMDRKEKRAKRLADKKSKKKSITSKIREQVEARKKKEQEMLTGDAGPGDRSRDDGKPKITSKFVVDCLYANTLGDGILYAELHRGKFLYHNLAQNWLVWLGNHWTWDIDDEATKAVEEVAKAYIDCAYKLVDKIDWSIKKGDKEHVRSLQKIQGDLYKRATRLRSDHGRESCKKFARTNNVSSLDIRGDEFDSNPWFLAFRNGIVDLRTGNLRPGRPDDFIIRASQIDFININEPAPLWEKTLVDIFNENHEEIEYLQRLIGYASTGLTVEHILPILEGKDGRNGKGLIVRLLIKTLGDYAAPIQSEMLLDSGHVRSSSAPTPDILDLKGLRIAFASETDSGRRFSAARCKLLSGGDPLKGRWPHDKKPEAFDPTHMLIMITNFLPHVNADDNAFWERVHVLKFRISFVRREVQTKSERQADIYLEKKLELELPGIAAWIVRGCLAWQQQGLNPPKSVTDATEEYRRDEDDLASFIEDECVTGVDEECLQKVLYDRFCGWWEAHISKKRIPSDKRFGKLMVRKFERVRRSVGNVFIGLDVKIKMEDENIDFPGCQGD